MPISWVLRVERMSVGMRSMRGRTGENEPKKDRKTTPEVKEGNPDETADTEEEDVEVTRLVDVGDGEAPFSSLRGEELYGGEKRKKVRKTAGRRFRYRA